MPAKSLELQHTLRLIRELDAEIDEIENCIKQIMDRLAPPVMAIPGISYRMGAMILSEIGDSSRFSSPDKVLAYAGLSPSTYQSGKLENVHAHISVFYTSVNPEDEDYFDFAQVSFSDQAAFESYIADIREQSLFEIPTVVEYGDSLLTLATCSEEYDGGRIVIVCVRIA